jgi:hypothetical protein
MPWVGDIGRRSTMHMSRVHLRWYKSFNVRYYGHTDRHPSAKNLWDSKGGADFPSVEIPIDKQITTVVGANETGKSHLLSSVAKLFTGNGVANESHDEYDAKDICRYCAFGALENDAWPSIGCAITCDTEEEYKRVAKASGVEVNTEKKDRLVDGWTFTFILDGSNPKAFCALYGDDRGHLSTISREKWMQLCESAFPRVCFNGGSLE